MTSTIYIPITPVEFDLKRRDSRKPRILRHSNIDISSSLTQESFERVYHQVKVKKKPTIEALSQNRISFKYPSKPPIIIDLLRKEFFVTKETLEAFGESICMQQVSIITRILNDYGYASFNRKTITLDYEKFGRTKEERAQTYKAMELAFERLD